MDIKFFHKFIIDALQRLGIIGTISYMGAILLFFAVTKTDFKIEVVKALVLMGTGTMLLVFSGVVYWLQSKEETAKVKEALGVLREVYNRMAEQISVADKDKTVSITMTIDNLPDKISEVIKKTAKVDN